MARMTQYIGLNDAAKKFLADFGYEDVSGEYPNNFTYGMFEEKIPLGTYRNKYSIVREVVQVVPWSSGPMIFTCLKNKKGELLHEWIPSEDVRGQEYDSKSGKFWV